MKTEEKKSLAFGVFLWILIVGGYLFSPRRVFLYEMIGTLLGLPFSMWSIWHLHQTWKPWGLSGQKSDNQQENHGMWLMIAVIGSVLVPNLISTFASPEIESFIMGFLGICLLPIYSYIMIQVIRYRPRR